MTFLVLALADVPAWLLPVPIFVAVASNGAIMGNSAALAMAEVRPVAGTGSAVLGFSQFAARRPGLAARRPRRRGTPRSCRRW